MEGLLAQPPGIPKPGMTPGIAEPMASPAAMQAAPAASAEMEQATPEEQQELEKGIDAAVKIIHDDPKTHKAIAGMIKDDDPVAGVFNASKQVILGADRQMDFSMPVLLEMVGPVVDLVLELGDAMGVKLDDNQQKTAVMYTQMAVLDASGHNPEGGTEFVEGMSNEEQQGTMAVMEGMQ
jgi:hypothetical protein